MARVRRRNQALKFFVNGRAARSLEGIGDAVGNVLGRYDTACVRAVAGVKRRAAPAASRAARQEFGVKASSLSGKYRAEIASNERQGDALSLWASARRLPLLDFGGRWGGRKTAGATAEVHRGDRTTYDHAFLGTVRGLKAIRVRSYESTGRRAARGPLRMLRGPSPWEMVSGASVPGQTASQNAKRAVLAELTTFYVAELRRQFALARG